MVNTSKERKLKKTEELLLSPLCFSFFCTIDGPTNQGHLAWNLLKATTKTERTPNEWIINKELRIVKKSTLLSLFVLITDWGGNQCEQLESSGRSATSTKPEVALWRWPLTPDALSGLLCQLTWFLGQFLPRLEIEIVKDYGTEKKDETEFLKKQNKNKTGPCCAAVKFDLSFFWALERNAK